MESAMTRRVSLILLLSLSAAPLAAQTALEDKFFESKGVNIRYVDVGRGDPVVLVHGFSSSLDGNWATPGVIAALAKDFRVIALDCRGHGKSDKPHDTAAYGIEMVDDVARLMDHLAIRRAHIVGYSMGGAITGKFVTTHADRAISATLGGAAPRLAWTAQNERDAEELAASLEQGRGLRPLVLRLLPPNEPRPSEEDIDKRAKAAVGRNDVRALAAVTRANKGQVVTPSEIKAVKAPMLAVIGTADPIIAGVKSFKALVPSLKVVEIQGATHSGARGAVARPEFAAAVREFLQANRLPTSR
jgi:pimeloyl-ACP methyl ester carboxylesterase